MVDMPAFVVIQKSRNPPVTVPAILGSQSDNITAEKDFFIG